MIEFILFPKNQMKMENGAYVSSPQLPPQAHLSAAAAFQAAAANSAAGGSVTPFQEALMSRMGRPFGLTVRLKCFSNFTYHYFGIYVKSVPIS